MNRRKFIRQTGMASIAGAYSLSSIQAFAASQKDKVRIGIIGTGMRGQNHIEMMLERSDVDITALADPDPRMLADALALIQKAGKPIPAT
jgi:ornithine cyclodeaminase/alanine dehydrogenase-like protein (mu-crystallin family)